MLAFRNTFNNLGISEAAGVRFFSQISGRDAQDVHPEQLPMVTFGLIEDYPDYTDPVSGPLNTNSLIRIFFNDEVSGSGHDHIGGVDQTDAEDDTNLEGRLSKAAWL